jgi:HPt (histidine-containing phosphotransfer) domain-containing protein
MRPFHLDPDIADLFPVFLAARKKDVENIEQFLVGRNFKQLARTGHAIRGSGGSFGFPAISALGGELEDAAGREDLSAIQRIVQSLRVQLADAERAITSFTPDRG